MEPSTPQQVPPPPPEEKPLEIEPNPPLKPGGVIGADGSNTVTSLPPLPNEKPKRNRKKLILAAITAVLLVGGASAAAYIGLVVVNQPQKIWSDALDNTNRGYEKLITYGEQKKDLKGTKIDGSLKMGDDQLKVDGTFSGGSSEKSGSFKADIGGAGIRVNVESRFIVPENSEYPDIYAKVSGVKGLTAMGQGTLPPQVLAEINKLDNQWLVVDHSIFNSLSSRTPKETESAALTNDDMIQIARAIGEVNKEYLLTDDPSKAVLKIAQEVGEEKRDGRDVYHFKVGYDKGHLKTYVTAMKDKLKTTKLVELLPGGSEDLEKSINFEGMLKSIDELKGDEQADVWVDMETRLIRAVRFTDKEDSANYFEIALNYNGGDDFPFVITSESSGDSGTKSVIGLTMQPKSNAFKLSFDVHEKTAKNPFTVEAEATIQMTNDVAEVAKPEGAKSWTELMPIFNSLFYTNPQLEQGTGQALPFQL